MKSHAVITGWTEIGEESVIFPFATVGEVPQDLKYAGEHTRLVVGKRCRIREAATLNTGTEGGGGVTRVGDDVLIMTGAHVGHDAQIGDRVILVNHVAVAGHCVLGDDVIVGGLSGIHQWVRIGQGAIIGAVTMVTNDVIPYGLVQGPRGELDGSEPCRPQAPGCRPGRDHRAARRLSRHWRKRMAVSLTARAAFPKKATARWCARLPNSFCRNPTAVS